MQSKKYAMPKLSENKAEFKAERQSGAHRERGIIRLFQIFEALHAHGRPIRIGALARLLNAPRSSIYSLVGTLLEARLLETAADDTRVFFGKQMYIYGLNYMRDNPLARRARDEVDMLARETGETAEFCMLQGNRYTIVHMSPGARPFRISSSIGLQIPIPWTASGRLLLADHTKDNIRALLEPQDLVLPDGRRIEFDAFYDAIQDARKSGFCLTRGLVDAYTQCLAAPIRGEGGAVLATICLVLPIDTTEGKAHELRQRLLESSKRISELG